MATESPITPDMRDQAPPPDEAITGGSEDTTPEQSTPANAPAHQAGVQDGENVAAAMTPSDDPKPKSESLPPPSGHSADEFIDLGFHRLSTIYEIPEWSTSFVKAYHCEDKRAKEKSLLAFVYMSEAGIDEATVRNLIETPLFWSLRVRAFEIIDWPPEGRRWPVIVTDRPEARPLWVSLQTKSKPIPEDKLITNFIVPMARLLRSMEQDNMVHGALNPVNICLPSKSNQYQLRLPHLCLPGEQDPVFETLYRAICDPHARGKPTIANDMFAFGVTILSLLNGHMPGNDTDESKILNDRFENGSLLALTRNINCSHRMLDCLTGLLHDEDESRWDINNLWMWLNGWKQRNPHTKSINSETYSKEAIKINNNNCTHVRSVIWEMSRMGGKAVDLIESNQMERWIKKGFSGTALVPRYDEVITRPLISRTIDRKEWTISACMALLDLQSPFYAKGSFYADQGVVSALTHYMIAGRDIEPFHFIYGAQLPSMRIRLIAEQRNDTSLDTVQKIAEKRRMEEAISGTKGMLLFLRQIYQENLNQPCLNSFLRRYYITNTRDFLVSLEELFETSERPHLSDIFDDHTCAFLYAHSGIDKSDKKNDGLELKTPESVADIILIIKSLVKFQTLNRLTRLPIICRWLSENMDLILEGIKNRHRRESTRTQLARAAPIGNIRAILQILTDPGIEKDDSDEFTQAQREYNNLQEQIVKVERFLDSPASEDLMEYHYQSAILFGTSIAIVLIFILTLWMT
ncbi:MAG: hypothetical protein AAF442_01310 [Pseudomonadota bacterium]